MMSKNWKRVPTILQMEAVECGAASLSMILSSYGVHIPLERLRVECGVSRDGSNASNILKAAKKFGLSGKGYRKNPEALKNIRLPAIIHWNFNHFLVLEGFRGKKVYLNDPACGRRIVSQEELDQSFTGVVLIFEKLPEFRKIGKRENLFQSVKGLLRSSCWPLLFVIFTGLTLVIPGLLVPVFSKVFIDEILLQGRENWITVLLLGMAATAVLRGVLGYFQGFYLVKLKTKIAISCSAKFLWRLLHLPIGFFSQRYAGEIVDRVEANDSIAENLSGKLTEAVIDLFMALFYLALLFLYDSFLTMVCFFPIGMNVLFICVFSERMKVGNQKLLQDRGKMIGVSMGGLQLIETLKAGGCENDFFRKWAGFQAKQLNSEQSLERLSYIFLLIPEILSSLNALAILILGGVRVMDGVMTLGTLVAYQSLMMSFQSPINRMVSLAVTFQELKGDLNRVDDVMNYKIENFLEPYSSPSSEEAAKKQCRLEGEIELRDITFGYNILEAPLIENFSLKMKPGARIALVGGSGSGKSTVSKIVSGLYPAWSGTILLDGIEREKISKETLCASISVVDQDISLFEGTIKENLSLWDSTILEEDLLQAAKDACIHEEICLRPGGYLHRVEEDGSNFSGGQRQRLEIARALAVNPRILILDEATSALDPKTEQKIDENIRRRGCTCIIVAHRLSTVRDCDEIILLQKGAVVERGTHEELIRKGGVYSQLVGTE